MYFRPIPNPHLTYSCSSERRKEIESACQTPIPRELITLILSYQASPFSEGPKSSEQLTAGEGRIKATGVQQGEVIAYHEAGGVCTLLERALGPRNTPRFQRIFQIPGLDRAGAIARGEYYYFCGFYDEMIAVGLREKGAVYSRPFVNHNIFFCSMRQSYDAEGDRLAVVGWNKDAITICRGYDVLEIRLAIGTLCCRWLDRDTLLIDSRDGVTTYNVRDKSVAHLLPYDPGCFLSAVNSQRTHLFRVTITAAPVEEVHLITYELPLCHEVARAQLPERPARLIADGRTVVFVSKDQSEFHFWDTEDGMLISKLSNRERDVHHFALHGTTFIYSELQETLYLHHF